MDESASETLEFATRGDDDPDGGRSFCLIVMEGPDKGATFALTTGVSTLGRIEGNHFVVNGRGISRKHVSITVKAHGEVIIEDQQSTNGVYINGKKVTRQSIEPGQTVALGPEVKLRLELSARSVQTLLQEMYECATLDSLTGLFTRRGFEERLDVEFAMVRRHRMHSCLAVVDIDRFKAVNDSEGHDAGDVVLQALASVLKENVRVGDLACRWGGEEFTIYLRQTPLIGAVTLMQRLREQFAATAIELPKGNRTSVTFSAGVVDLLDFEDWRDGFRRADEALYQAKRDGRNRVDFYSADGG
jgi:diguanylate cyclase (GGDEF)-like protein